MFSILLLVFDYYQATPLFPRYLSFRRVFLAIVLSSKHYKQEPTFYHLRVQLRMILFISFHYKLLKMV